MSSRRLGKYRIEQHLVDFDRNQIGVGSGAVISIEPKIMEMLRYLIEHKGEVVSTDELLEHVWDNTSFSSSTVQRGIAILRKAFGDDTKVPRFIKTYPKRGYSLIASAEPIDTKPSTSKSSLKIAFATAVLFIIFAFAGIAYFPVSEPVKTEFTELFPITSTGQNEYSAQFSPEGDYLLFLRDELDGAANNIWLKRIADDKEFKLTDSTQDFYQGISWSHSGDYIVFLHKSEQSDRIGLLSIDLRTANLLSKKTVKTYPPRTVLGHQFQMSASGVIYFIVIPRSGESQLLSLDSETLEVKVLASATGKDVLQNLALSPDGELLAYTKSVRQNLYQIHILNLASERVQHLTSLENGILGISWHPGGEHLLASNDTKLQLVNLLGESEEIRFNNFKGIIDASFSPDGKQIVFQSIDMDVDILMSTFPYEQLERIVDSEAVDILPSFSPDESQVVFMSDRNGWQQLFLKELNGQTQMIFNNPARGELFGYAWSPNGEQIVAADKDTLYFIELQSGRVTQQKHGEKPFYIKNWYKHKSALLVTHYEQDRFVPAEFNYVLNSKTSLSEHLEAVQCSYITLDSEDNVFVTDGESVLRLSAGKPPETVWQSPVHNIHGFSVYNDELIALRSYSHDTNSEFFTRVNLQTFEESRLYQYNRNDFRVAGGNIDNSKLLIHSFPERVRTIRLLE